MYLNIRSSRETQRAVFEQQLRAHFMERSFVTKQNKKQATSFVKLDSKLVVIINQLSVKLAIILLYRSLRKGVEKPLIVSK